MPDNLRINIRAMTPDERGFAYTQPDLFETSGCIGHLRVDMGNTGTQFFSSWDDHQADLKTSDFKTEFDTVINALRNDGEYGGILASRTALASYCLRQPESTYENGREYGFRVDTDKYSYLLRLNPNRGDYAAYCYAYEKETLDRYLYDKPIEQEMPVPEDAQDPAKKSNKERLKEITDSIERGIRDVFNSGKFENYLATMSRFHRYSLNNTILIYMQKPDATRVAGFNKWKEFKTAKSILISCGARLAPFDIQELRDLTAYDELQLDTLGDRKTALFIIMSDTDDTFNFLISLCYTQLFNLLCEKADDVYGGRLPAHVRCLIDEAANIGQIPRLEKLVATIRSREISCCLVLQAQSQLKALYKDNADTIIGNMDCSIFLGGKEPTPLKELATALGKETIDTFNTGESRGREISHSLNYQKLGKELMSVDELAVLDGGKCILQLRGVRPFLSDKYDITKHPNYKLTADFDERNTFDVQEYLQHRLKLKGDEVCSVYEADLPETTEAPDETIPQN